MPLDPEFVAEARGWFVRAASDLRAARLLLDADPPLGGDAAYHCQQATEKTLKGYLAWSGRTFRKTHNIGELSSAVVEFAADLGELLRGAAGLTEYAWRFRYPGEPQEPSHAEVEEALSLARRVHDAVLSMVPEEVRP